MGTGLAEAVERGEQDEPEVKAALIELLGPALDQGMDTLVLACTHYPFLRQAIATVTGEAVTVVDPSAAVARQVARTLERNGAKAPRAGASGVTLATTGDPDALERHTQRLDLPGGTVFRRW